MARSEDLRAAVPGASVLSYSSREKLLTAISELPPVGPNEQRPLALIDLQDDKNRNAHGEHLLATINEHPHLTDRVALVAFTRYGFDSHDDVLEAKGARAVLSPLNLAGQEGLVEELELLASGPTRFVHIGEPPSRSKDKEVLRKLASFFPSLDALDERERWMRAREILRVCQLDSEGFDDKAIWQDLEAISRRGLKDLQDELLRSPGARAAELIKPMEKRPALGKLIEVLQSDLNETPLIWDVTNERERLEGPGLLTWTRERVADRYPPDGMPIEGSDDAWIPPDYLHALRRFLVIHEELSHNDGRRHPSAKTLRERTSSAIEHVAGELGLETEQAHHYVSHAVMCLEDAEAERSGET